MAECNPVVNYSVGGESVTVIYQDTGRDCQFQWCYQIIARAGAKPATGPVLVSLIIPLCPDITSEQVTNRTVVGNGSFSTTVGLDPDTNIYGIRFNISEPIFSATVCFRTPPRIPASQPLGVVTPDETFNDQTICSPGCVPCSLQTRGIQI